MVATTDSGTVPADTPTKTSAPAIASSSEPVRPALLVKDASSRFTSVRSVRPECTMPRESHHRHVADPRVDQDLRDGHARGPGAGDHRAQLAERAARDLGGVAQRGQQRRSRCRAGRRGRPGCPARSRSRRSISKQRGAEMSSRLMPPKAGASRTIVSTSSSVSVQSRQIGTASTPPNCLNSTALPSITGSAASGPMSPRPSTAVPSVTTATVLRLPGVVHGQLGLARRSPCRPRRRRACRRARGPRGRAAARWRRSPSCRRGAARRRGSRE